MIFCNKHAVAHVREIEQDDDLSLELELAVAHRVYIVHAVGMTGINGPTAPIETFDWT